MLRSLTAAVVFVVALIAGVAIAAGAPLMPTIPEKQGVNFADARSTLDLHDWLKPYHASAAAEQDGSSWYTVTVANGAEHPITRIVFAIQPTSASLRIMQRRGVPSLLQVASSDAGVTVETARAFGRHAFAVTIPPATSATIAVRVINAEAPPIVQAWTIPALVLRNKQLAIFLAAVAGLIAASIAITAGVAVMTAHLASRWATIVLTGIFLVELTTSGMFETGWIAIGGPYGFSAMIGGLTLAAAIRLADLIAPVDEVWPKAKSYLIWSQRILLALCAFAFVGVPASVFFLEIVTVFGTAVIAAYLVQQGVSGVQAARVVAPSAAIFSLVALGAVVVALGGFQDNPAASSIIDGFAAAGAVLLSLAICAGEGISIMSGTRPVINVPSAEARTSESAFLDEGLSPSSRDAYAAIGASHQGVFDLDFATGSVHLSPEATNLLGMQEIGTTFSHSAWIERIHAEDRRTYKQALREYRTQPGLAYRMEFRVRNESGRYLWLELRATIMGEHGSAARCLGLIADVTTRKEAEISPAGSAHCDSLTGLGNRVALMEELEALGTNISDVGFVLLDIDRFKSVHASLGDDGGDEILVGIARRLTQKLGSRAKVFRAGGDAFAVLAAVGGSKAAGIGSELVTACNRPFRLGDRDIFVTSSAGAASGHDADDPLELLKNAELALLQAKRQGGACSRFYSRDLEAFAPGDAVALETDLRKALEENQFEVYYQPIVHAKDGRIAGFEALLRWNHPLKGVLLPAEFIAHAEETGLIVSLGRLALERAASDLADWQRFFPMETPLFVSVNVSRRQLRDEHFENLLGPLVSQSGLHPDTLKLEITESAIAGNDNAVSIVGALRSLGVGIGIDDFGTGLSSLGQLKDMPFDFLKIDKSFLTQGTEAQDGIVILSSMVSLARELQRDVVVEGVETENDAARVCALGCEYAQGFYFSPPLHSAEALKFIARWHGGISKSEDGRISSAANTAR